jgi:hypothetical protein
LKIKGVEFDKVFDSKKKATKDVYKAIHSKFDFGKLLKYLKYS